MRISPMAHNDEDLIEATPPGPPPGARLPDQTPRSGMSMEGPKALLIGIVLAWLGSKGIINMLLGRVEPSGDAPVWVGGSSALFFAFIGTLLVVHGARAIRTESQTRRLRPTRPGEPWAWDHPWSAFGARDDSSRTIARHVKYVVFFGLLLAPMHWAFMSGEETDRILLVATLSIDVMIAITLVRIGYLLVRRGKYGAGVLRFRRFPFLTGGDIEVSLARIGPLAHFHAMHATLRCVQERFETSLRRGKRRTRTVCYEVWSETKRSLEGEGGRPVRRDFTWRFTVPEDAPGTSLSNQPSRYWELEVTAEAPGVDYGAVFLIPVYQAPGAERRARLAG